MGGQAVPPRAGLAPRQRRGSAGTAGGTCRTGRGSPARPEGFRRHRRARLRAPQQDRRAGSGAGGSRYRHRQDHRLYRASKPVGGTQPGHGMDFDLYQEPATPARSGTFAALSRSGGEGAQGGDPQGPGKLSVPAQFRGDRRPGGAGRRRRHHRPRDALGAGKPRRRHGGGRLPRLARPKACQYGGTGRRDADRPARRMRLQRLPAFQEMFHRARNPESAPGRHRGGEPCARHAAGGPRPRRLLCAAAKCA